CESRGATLEGDIVKAGLGDGEHGPAGRIVELEHDESGRLCRIVAPFLDRERMPAKRNPLLRLDRLDSPLERRAGVRLLKLCDFRIDFCRNDTAFERPAGNERSIEVHSEPRSELSRIADRA